jgi:Zn-dependent protease with chaperone function
MADKAVHPKPSMSGRAAASWQRFMSQRLPGLPPGLGTMEWLTASSVRMPVATAAALLGTWTAVTFSLWIGVYTAMGSVILVLFGAAASGHVVGILHFTSHTGTSIDVLVLLTALFAGFGLGFADSYTASLSSGLPEVAIAVLIGIALAVLIGRIAMNFEGDMLRWRGYRRPSEREFTRTLLPAIEAVEDAMGITGGGEQARPNFMVADTPVPLAWAQTRHVVVSTGLMQNLDAAELQAVIAHELAHWQRGDPIALRMVWAFSWPLAVTYHVGMFLAGARYGTPQTPADVAPQQGNRNVLAAIGWFFLWPTYILIRFVIGPATAYGARAMEYEADAAVVRAGLGGALLRALERIEPFEPPRTAWEAVLSSSHPPMALRVEAIENLDPDSEAPEHITLSKKAVGSLFGLCAVLLAIALAHLIPNIPVHHHSWWNPLYF